YVTVEPRVAGAVDDAPAGDTEIEGLVACGELRVRPEPGTGHAGETGEEASRAPHWLMPRAAIGQTPSTRSPRTAYRLSYRLTVGSQCGTSSSRRSPTRTSRC